MVRDTTTTIIIITRWQLAGLFNNRDRPEWMSCMLGIFNCCVEFRSPCLLLLAFLFGHHITGRQEAKTKVGRLWNGLAGTDGNSIEAVPLNDLGYIEA